MVADGTALLAVSIAVLAGAAPFARDAMRPLPDRTGAPGALLDLPGGGLWYRWHGDAGAPVLVCLSGLTTPSVAFHALVPRLTASGWRVLAVDLYGRGLSDRPRGPQDAAFFRAMLTGLLDALVPAQPVAILGYSMGGAIATDFAARHPGRVRRLVLLASAGLGVSVGRLPVVAARWRGIGDWAFHLGYPASLRAYARTEAADAAGAPVAVALHAALGHRGFLRSVLASVRGILAQDHEPAHRAVAAAGVPVTAIWGADDTVIPHRARDRLAAFHPGAAQVVIEGASHGLPWSHAAAVAAAVPAPD